MKRWVFIILALNMTAQAVEPAAKLPFWKAKEKVYTRIQSGEVIVSVMSVDAVAPFAHRMTINGAGHVRAPRDFVFNYAQDFDQIARLSGYIESAKYDKEAGTIDLHIKALGFKSDVTLSVKTLKEEDPPRIDFRIIKGPLTGMENQISFAELPRTKTEVGIHGNYSYDKFPIPKMFLEFGLEVVFQRMASRLRQQAEAAYRAEGPKK